MPHYFSNFFSNFFSLVLSEILLYYVFMQNNEAVQTSGIDLLYKPSNIQQEGTNPPVDKGGFSFLDFLVILSAFLVIAFLGYLVLNPDKQGADERNMHRSADIASILTSISNYVNTTGEIPEAIPVNKECVAIGNEICKIGPYNCKGLVDLSFLVDSDNSKLTSLPTDPVNKSVNGTGYYISYDGAGNVTICAPYAERNVNISFTRLVF